MNVFFSVIYSFSSTIMNTKAIDSMAIETVQKIEMVSRIIKTKKELQNYIHHLKKNIFILSKSIRTRSSCVKNFSRIESALSILKQYLGKFKLMLKYKLKNKTKCKLIWQDVESCFKNRMKTGIITNLAYKDPKIFFKKS
jgi:hypothetical protein